MDEQPELPLPPPPLRPDQLYLPARMVNEFQYCPRLAYLEWVQGEWAESADCVQGLVLEDNGYRCGEGALYFRESRERVRVRFDDALRSKALAAVHGLRLVAAGGRIPPPLEDSPKCPRCSLVGICLPDEVNFFRYGAAPRSLAVERELALPVYVQSTPGRVRKRGE